MTYDIITSNQTTNSENTFLLFGFYISGGDTKVKSNQKRILRLSAEYEPESVDQPVTDTCDGVADEFPKSAENLPERIAGDSDAAGRGGRVG